MTIELPISIRKANLESILRAYSLAHKEKPPKKIDKDTWDLVNVLYNDSIEDEKEEPPLE